mgnify:CR=1 FL=1
MWNNRIPAPDTWPRGLVKERIAPYCALSPSPLSPCLARSLLPCSAALSCSRSLPPLLALLLSFPPSLQRLQLPYPRSYCHRCVEAGSVVAGSVVTGREAAAVKQLPSHPTHPPARRHD